MASETNPAQNIKKAQRGIMTTDGLLSVTNWIYLLSLFVAAVASVGLWRLSIASGEEKDRQLEQYKIQSADEIEKYKADASVRIAQASGAAETAKAEAARANERAAALEKDAAEARMKQQKLVESNLKLEAQISPRRLTSISAVQVNKLLPFRGQTVLVKSYQMDADAALLGGQIIDIFEQIGFKIIDRRMGDGSVGGIALGILVSGSNTTLRDAVVEIFNQTGLKSQVGSPPRGSGIFVGDPDETGNINIFIGVKPPA